MLCRIEHVFPDLHAFTFYSIRQLCIFSFLLFAHPLFFGVKHLALSYDVASGSEITPCNKIDKPLVVYRFTGNVMTSITTLRA